MRGSPALFLSFPPQAEKKGKSKDKGAKGAKGAAGGAAAADAPKPVDPSRLDMRVGKIIECV